MVVSVSRGSRDRRRLSPGGAASSVDERPPLSLTSDGYLFATADPERGDEFARAAKDAEARGVGPARRHTRPGSDYEPAPADGFENQPTASSLDMYLLERRRAHLRD